MKIALLWIGVVALALVLCFYAFAIIPAPKASVALPDRARSSPPETAPLPAEAETDLEARYAEALRRVDESGRRMAAHETPEMLASVVAAGMRAREPHCRKLFEVWKLDPLLAEEVLKVIYERQTKISDAQHHASVVGHNGYREAAEVGEIERSLASLQLKSLLGEARLKEFEELEERMFMDAKRKTMRQLND